MYKHLFFALFLVLSSIPVMSQSSPDELAIVTLLDKETADFSRLSIADLVKKHWILDDKTEMAVTMPDGSHIQSKLQDMMELTAPAPGDATVAVKSDWKFTITGDAAFVSFSQTATTADGDKVYSHEFRFLRKVNDAWKIHVSSVHQYTPKG